MPARPRRQRRLLLLPVSIALLLAAETSAAALAFAPRTVPVAVAPSAPALPVADRAADELNAGSPSATGAAARRIRLLEAPRAAAVVAAKPSAPRPVVEKPVQQASPAAPKRTYTGTNHVWIPSLGINRAVAWFPCSRTKPPGHQVYRWGCAGANNVYLFGHASSVMKPLHDAYVRGRLRKGMEVYYADAKGRVTRYVVTYWRVVRPDGDIGWAYAGQSRPSLTLQTCVGANSAYRLVVRLVARG